MDECRQAVSRTYPEMQERGSPTYETDCTSSGHSMSCTTRRGAPQADWYALGSNAGNAIAQYQAIERCMYAKGFRRN